MDWQLGLVLVIVAAAAGYLGWQAWRSWRGAKLGCGGTCGCARKASASTAPEPQTTLIPRDELTLRRRPDGPSAAG